MQKAKRGPALFEVLCEEQGQTSDALKVPPWWAALRGQIKQEPTGATAAGSDNSGKGTQAPPVAVDEPVPLIVIDGGRVRLSFTSVTAAVAVFVGLTAILAAFEVGSRSGFKSGLRIGHEAGRASYAAKALDEIEVARKQPPATHLVSSLLAQTKSANPMAGKVADGKIANPDKPVWIRDYTYIVAQEFTAGRTEPARRAKEFLARHEVATELVVLPGRAIQLITTQGYNHKDSTQKRIAEQLLEKVHRVGAKYYASGGGYRLKGYFKTLKGDSW